MHELILKLRDEITGDVYKITEHVAKEAVNELNTEISKHGHLTLYEYKSILRKFFNCDSLNYHWYLDDVIGFLCTGKQTFKLTPSYLANQEECTGELLCLHAAVYNAAEKRVKHL